MKIAIDLIRMTEQDIPMVLEWMEQEDILKYFGDPIEWLEEMNTNVNKSDWIWYFIAHTDEPIGFCQFYDTAKAPKGIWSDEKDPTAGIDFFIAYANLRGIGKGKDLIKELLDKIKATNQFKFVLADVESQNETAKIFIESCGFVKYKPGLWRYDLANLTV